MEADELRRIIKRLGVYQRDVAKAIGVTEGAVSHWLVNNRPIPGPAAYAIRAWAKDYQKAE